MSLQIFLDDMAAMGSGGGRGEEPPPKPPTAAGYTLPERFKLPKAYKKLEEGGWRCWNKRYFGGDTPAPLTVADYYGPMTVVAMEALYGGEKFSLEFPRGGAFELTHFVRKGTRLTLDWGSMVTLADGRVLGQNDVLEVGASCLIAASEKSKLNFAIKAKKR